MQRAYKYISDHRLPKQGCKIEYKVQKLIREKSSHLAGCLTV